MSVALVYPAFEQDYAPPPKPALRWVLSLYFVERLLSNVGELIMQIVGDPVGSILRVAESSDGPNLKVILVGVGNTLLIDENCTIQGSIFLANGATVEIGKSLKCTGAMAFHCHEGSMVKIGDNCLFSQNVQFRPSDAHKIYDLRTNLRINGPKPIRIGNGVWIGQEVMFLKGAEIPDGCVVGARSMVTKSFDEPNCVIVGSPAGIVRRHVRWAP